MRRAEARRLTGTQFELGVLGCADGKFVLPAARKGLRVLAIDCDPIALFGGQKLGVDGPCTIPGLTGRLERECLTDRVAVVERDFLRLTPVECSAVWVSGAIQYSFNAPNDAARILTTIQRFVAPGGLLYVDYMLPFEEKYRGRPNCPDAEWWDSFPGSLTGWSVKYNRVLRPVLDRAHIEFPVDHYHQWGHILMERALD